MAERLGFMTVDDIDVEGPLPFRGSSSDTFSLWYAELLVWFGIASGAFSPTVARRDLLLELVSD